MRKQLVLGALAVVLAGATTLDTTTCCLRGWWNGEAFFRGRPTSYWGGELARWQPIFT